MNDEHNRHDPFAAPDPERFDPAPERFDPAQERFEPAPERFEPPRPVDPEPPRAAQISERIEAAEPTVSPEHAANPFGHTEADAPPSGFTYAPVNPPPHDPLIGPDPLLSTEHGAV